MDRNTDEYEKLSKDPDKLLEYLADRIETMNRVLDDDESFCNKDIETSKRYIKTIEEKFLQQTQKLKDKLEQLRLENEQVSKENKEQYTREIENINELFSTNKYEGLLKSFIIYFYFYFLFI